MLLFRERCFNRLDTLFVHDSYTTYVLTACSLLNWVSFTVKNDAILSSEKKTTFQTTRYQIPQDYGTKRIDGL